MISFNIESVKSNYLALQHYHPDIILLQEHWLWQFESDSIEDIFPSFDCAIKCADDDDPIQNSARKRGRAGVATLWSKKFSHLVKTHQDGSDRILIITIECSPLPLCIINTYLPSQGSADFKTTYASHLDQLYEICQKFKDHILILGGDINASLLQPKYQHDNAAIEAFQEMHLLLPKEYPSDDTFHSHNGRDNRHIDYFLSSHPDVVEVLKPLKPSSNTSSHDPIISKLDIALHFKDEPAMKISSHRSNWSKADTILYKDLICKDLIDFNKSDVESMHENLTCSLTSAASQAMPIPKSTRRKSKIPLSKNVKEKLKVCRSLSHHSSHLDPQIKHAKRELRRAIRMENAKSRNVLYNNLMETCDNNSTTMYKLISKQRKSSKRSIHSLKVDGDIINDNKGLLQAWASHFKKLGSKLNLQSFDEDHERRITSMRKCINQFIDLTKPYKDAKSISPTEVQKAINKLNNNKAADSRGLTAEHLKHAQPHILTPLSILFTECLHQGIQPHSFSSGSLTPVGKKGKDLLDPNNSRGIVISPILAKTYEHIIDNRESGSDETDDMQFGFTSGKSPTMAALITSEAIAENKDKGQHTYIASLDTQKAFDVVWQDSLAIQNFLTKPNECWKAHTMLLEKTNLQVKLGGELSDPFEVEQGVGQGKILSTKNYKDFLDPSLKIYKASGVGCYIGIYYVGSPTCADDVLLISSSIEDLQTLLSIAYQFSQQERFIIHPLKTKIIICNYKGPKLQILHQWKLGETELLPSNQLTHLGITRYASTSASNAVIEERVKLARRTAYSLLGAGFHGTSGINNSCLKRIMDIYVLPRLFYGLESLIITDKQKKILDDFYKGLLKQIQSLPKRTANEAPYVLFDTIPAEGLLDIRILTFLGKILSDPSSILYQICLRQMATKSLSSNSWFIAATKLTHKYDLPSPHKLLQQPLVYTRWKKLVKATVIKYWQHHLKQAIQEKSSLILLHDVSVSPSWKHVKLNCQSVARARIQARLMTNTLTLQAHRASFYGEDPTCKLCNLEPETTTHLLTTCPAMSHMREELLDPIYEHMYLSSMTIPKSKDDLAKLLLGITEYDCKVAHLASNICFKLVHQRHNLYI